MKIFEILLLAYTTLVVGLYLVHKFARIFNGENNAFASKGASLKRMFD